MPKELKAKKKKKISCVCCSCNPKKSYFIREFLILDQVMKKKIYLWYKLVCYLQWKRSKDHVKLRVNVIAKTFSNKSVHLLSANVLFCPY